MYFMASVIISSWVLFLQASRLLGARAWKIGIGGFVGLGLLVSSKFVVAAPPVPVTFLIQHDYDANIDLFGGGNYLTPDDNLILDSMTAAQGMSKLKRVEIAKENLEKLLNPADSRAPVEKLSLAIATTPARTLVASFIPIQTREGPGILVILSPTRLP